MALAPVGPTFSNSPTSNLDGKIYSEPELEVALRLNPILQYLVTRGDFDLIRFIECVCTTIK